MEATATLEVPEDIGRDDASEVTRWLLEIELAKKTEKWWRKDAKEAEEIYRSEKYKNTGDDERRERKETFNILWSNIEIKRPSLYNSMPRPDVRRRFRDKDVLGKHVAELMERCVTYTLDCQEFDEQMILAANDMLLPGRAITRVRYVPTFSEKAEEDNTEGEIDGTEATPDSDELDYEEVTFEQWQWDKFLRGPGRTWGEVPWIDFIHELTKTEMEERFKDFADKVNYDVSVKEDDIKEMDDTNASVFKRCEVHEIWDKETRRVIFVAPSYKHSVIGREDDPLNLKYFWPIPRPLYAIESSTSLIPMTEYSMYETLAKELEKVTNRVRHILDGLRLRGVYDSTIKEVEKLFEEGDSKFIAVENLSRLIEAGGLEKAIWMLPVEIYAAVLTQLYSYRNGLIQQIYEITGISDIIRGATNPNETLGAQEIKANFGTQRLQRQQKDVQRYARDLVRLAVELIAENFSRETLTLMSGLSYPTMQEKQRAQLIIQSVQQQAMQAEQFMQALPPEQQQQYAQAIQRKKQQAEAQIKQAQEVLSKPSWEEIEEVLHSDMLREFRIDIETDSTIQAQQQEDQKNITELLGGIARFMNDVAPAIESGALSVEAAKKMLMAAVRRFKLGREVEDALEEIQPPQQNDAGAEQANMAAQMEQQKFQMEQQKSQQELAAKQQLQESEMEMKKLELAERQQEHQYKMAEMQRKAEIDAAKHQMEMQKLMTTKEAA